MKILVTGFNPFGGETVNPAYEAVKLLPDTIAGAEIIKKEIPTEFDRSLWVQPVKKVSENSMTNLKNGNRYMDMIVL